MPNVNERDLFKLMHKADKVDVLEKKVKKLEDGIENVISQTPDKWTKGYLEQLLSELTQKEGKQ